MQLAAHFDGADAGSDTSPATVVQRKNPLTLILGPKINAHSGFGVFFDPSELSVVICNGSNMTMISLRVSNIMDNVKPV